MGVADGVFLVDDLEELLLEVFSLLRLPLFATVSKLLFKGNLGFVTGLLEDEEELEWKAFLLTESFEYCKLVTEVRRVAPELE